MNNCALKIENLIKEYKDFTLDNASFEVTKGSIMGLIGQNGAGKTTIIKLIMNIIAKKNGTVSVYGLDNIENEVAVKNLIGYVADDDYLVVGSNLSKYSKAFKNMFDNWDQELFDELIKKWDLPLKKRFQTFSKGMKTKAMIALTLAHKPQLLILDEPTAGLDPVARIEVLDMLREFVADGEKAVLFSTHITGDLDKVADFVTMIINGEIKDSMSIDKMEEKYALITINTSDLEGKEDKLIGFRKGEMTTQGLILRDDISNFPNADVSVPNIEQILVFNIFNHSNEKLEAKA